MLVATVDVALTSHQSFCHKRWPLLRAYLVTTQRANSLGLGSDLGW